MPFPLIPVIAAGSQLLGQGINALTQSHANKVNWEHAKESYARERADNLSDWTRQNAYNHPSEQMKRLREAGLSPNLIYGGNTGIVTAQQPKSASQATPQNQPIQFDAGGIINQFLTTMQMQQQTDNLREINKNLVLEQQMRAIRMNTQDVQNLILHEKWTQEQARTKMFPQLLESSLDATKAGTALKNTQAIVMLDENKRRALQSAQSLQEGVKRMLQQDLQRAKTQAETNSINKAIQNIEKDGKIKQFEIELNKKGFTKSDPAYIRMASKLYDNYAPDWLKRLAE